tara:strand:+ start:460 stop:684 length:225 start_codon:yes stop_codon:yes gene_type:complete
VVKLNTVDAGAKPALILFDNLYDSVRLFPMAILSIMAMLGYPVEKLGGAWKLIEGSKCCRRTGRSIHGVKNKSR